MTRRFPVCTVIVTGLWVVFGAQPVFGTVETGWPAGTPNQCRDATDVFMNFEMGIEAAEIGNTNPGIEFTTTLGINWRYGDIRSENYNVYPYNGAFYEINGNFFAWLGESGASGRITFTGGQASYASVLVSTYSQVTMEAYDKDDVLLATSGWASGNLSTRTMTRLTVEADGIAYVIIHDTGNYWLMDDLCTDAPPICKPVPGRNTGDPKNKIDLVFVPDEDYGSPDDIDTWRPTFLGHVDHKIDGRLGGQAPVSGKLDKFNFYYTEKQGAVDNSNCAQVSSIPDDFVEDCPFVDAVVVLHQTTFGDCSTVGVSPDIFSSEGGTDRSFIHESGHGIFGLADEYDGAPACSTFYFQPDPKPNIWATEALCRADATAAGWNRDDCQKFTTCQSDWWKLGTTSYIMEDGTFFANGWGEPASRRIGAVLSHYGSSKVASKSKSLWFDLNITDASMVLLDKGFFTVPPPEYLAGSYDFVAQVFSTEGALLGEFGFGDPRRKYAEWDYTGPLMLDSADFKLVLPHFYNGSRVDIVKSASGEVELSIDISQFVGPIELDIFADGFENGNTTAWSNAVP